MKAKQKQKKQPKRRRGRSTQELLDIQGFTRYGLRIGKHELLYYVVSPTNISVLSNVNIAVKIHHLTMALSTLPDIEIVCQDSCECFDHNKHHMQSLLKKEPNPKVRRTLQKDLGFLDSIQIETSTARQFMFVARVKYEKEDQILPYASRVEKTIAEQGFEVRRLGKAEIKRTLAIHFEASIQGDLMGDVDGANCFETEGHDVNL